MSDDVVTGGVAADAATAGVGAESGDATAGPGDATAVAAKPPDAPPVPAVEPLPERVAKIQKATERVREETRKQREYEAKIRELEERTSALDMLDKDPDEALKRLGKSFDAVAKAKLAKMGMAKKAAEIPEEIRTQLEALQAQLNDARESALQARVAEERAKMQASINTELRNEERYELLHAEFGVNAPGRVFDLIQRHYQATEEAGEPEVLTAEQAASMLESALEESFARRAATKKARSKLGSTSAPQERREGGSETAMAPSLTNQLASPATSGPDAAPRGAPRPSTGLEFIWGKR